MGCVLVDYYFKIQVRNPVANSHTGSTVSNILLSDPTLL